MRRGARDYDPSTPKAANALGTKPQSRGLTGATLHGCQPMQSGLIGFTLTYGIAVAALMLIAAL
jgi:hypothetical protein